MTGPINRHCAQVYHSDSVTAGRIGSDPEKKPSYAAFTARARPKVGAVLALAVRPLRSTGKFPS
jgi:hypothetical protein